MIEQEVNELANAMESDPVQWAKNYIELERLVDKLEAMLLPNPEEAILH